MRPLINTLRQISQSSQTTMGTTVIVLHRDSCVTSFCKNASYKKGSYINSTMTSWTHIPVINFIKSNDTQMEMGVNKFKTRYSGMILWEGSRTAKCLRHSNLLI